MTLFSVLTCFATKMECRSANSAMLAANLVLMVSIRLNQKLVEKHGNNKTNCQAQVPLSQENILFSVFVFSVSILSSVASIRHIWIAVWKLVFMYASEWWYNWCRRLLKWLINNGNDVENLELGKRVREDSNVQLHETMRRERISVWKKRSNFKENSNKWRKRESRGTCEKENGIEFWKSESRVNWCNIGDIRPAGYLFEFLPYLNSIEAIDRFNIKKLIWHELNKNLDKFVLNLHTKQINDRYAEKIVWTLPDFTQSYYDIENLNIGEFIAFEDEDCVYFKIPEIFLSNICIKRNFIEESSKSRCIHHTT